MFKSVQARVNIFVPVLMHVKPNQINNVCLNSNAKTLDNSPAYETNNSDIRRNFDASECSKMTHEQTDKEMKGMCCVVSFRLPNEQIANES